MKARLLVGALVALALPASAHALTADRAVARDCTSVLRAGGAAGVVTKRFAAPAEGMLRARFAGKRRAGDWDLAAFDSRGRLIAGSSAFRANELVEVHLRRGAEITLQACRVAGRGRSVPLKTGFTKLNFEAIVHGGKVSLVEVPITAGWQIGALESLGLDVTHDVTETSARVLLYGARDRRLLARTGLGFDVVHPDLAAVERAARRADARYARRVGRSALPTGRTEYRTFEDVQQELKDMIAQHPDLVRPMTLPEQTYQGRDIQAVEIATDVASADDTRPVLYLNGIHHAREWPATEVIMEFAWDVLRNHGTDAELQKILDDTRIVLQPYTNVDGFIVSRGALGGLEPNPDTDAGFLYSTGTGVVILGGSFGYKRKNCNPYPAPDVGQPCEINLGTDNNRNYAHKWGGGGGSTNPNDQSYRGIDRSSEPETRAVQELQLSLNAPVLISMHNIAAKVLRPPGTEAEGLAPDEEGLKELGRRMAEPAGYTNEFGHQLYDVTGGTKDWAYAVTGAYGYTVETGPENGDFHGAYQSVVIDQYLGTGELAGRGMREALIAAAQWTRNEPETARIAGRAPAGRTLRITKQIETLSSPVCLIASPLPLNLGNGAPDDCVAPGDELGYDETVDITTKVPASGRFTWWLNPSTRPYAAAPEAYHLTCSDGDTVLEEREVVVDRGQTLEVDLACGAASAPPVASPTPAATATPAATGAPPNATVAPAPAATAPAATAVPPAATAAPVVTPPPNQPSARLALGRVRRAAGKVRVTVSARGGTLENVRVQLQRNGRTVRAVKLGTLTGTRTVSLKPRGRLKGGRYAVRVSAPGAAPTIRVI